MAAANTITERVRELVLESLRRHHLPPGSRLVVAVSGGPDSMCLLHVIKCLAAEADVELHVAHLDHQLRGENSRADADYVRAMADRLGLAATIESRDVQSYRAKKHISVEEAAREVRYAFLSEVARSAGASAAVVGHTRDDNVETILMHLVRGTGTRGLRGLQPVSDLRTPSGNLKVIRPLLDVSRVDTEGYCRENGIQPRVDESNRSMSSFRNRIRLELLPVLRRYNPAFGDALTRMGKIATDELDYMDREAALVWEEAVSRAGEAVVLDKKRLLALHPALRRQVLRRAVGEFVKDMKDIEARHIEELLMALHSPAGRMFELPDSLSFVVEHERYVLGRDIAESCPFPPLDGEYLLNVPGQTVASGWSVTATVLADKEVVASSAEHQTGAAALKGTELRPLSARNVYVQHVDYDSGGDKMSMRATQPGDRFQPLGLHGSKKVREFMIDAGIPRAWRGRIPVVVNSGGVVWVVGYRIDERVKVTEATKNALRLEFRKLA